jgi:chromosomal replication initiation ATPase DnaA
MKDRTKIHGLFFWARHRSDTEAAIDFVFRLGVEAGERSHKGQEKAARAVRNMLGRIRKAERDTLRKIRRGDPADNRESVIRETAAPVLEAVAKARGMSVRALLQRFSHKKVTEARREACWLLREKGMSFESIAIATERDDHTTAMHAVATVKARIAERPELRGELLRLVAAASGMRATG